MELRNAGETVNPMSEVAVPKVADDPEGDLGVWADCGPGTELEGLGVLVTLTT